VRAIDSAAPATDRLSIHRFRWRIRTLMVLVAVVAGATAFCEMRRRERAYRDRAWYHLAASHQLARDSRWHLCTFGLPERQAEAIRSRESAERTALSTAAEYHRRLRAKYERAAQRPWLPVEPDPPPPPGGNPAIVTADDY
jgi:hypothetical protein